MKSLIAKIVEHWSLSLSFGISGMLGLYFLVVQKADGTSFVYDAKNYLALATQYGLYLSGGELPLIENRTTAYPLFLLGATSGGRHLGLPEADSVFVLQLLVWWAAIAYTYFNLGKALNSKGPFGHNSLRDLDSVIPIGIWVTISIGANIFISPYLSVGLTDSLYVSLALMFLVWVTVFYSSPNQSLFLGVLFASLAITIRPAAIWLLIPLIVTIFS